VSFCGELYFIFAKSAALPARDSRENEESRAVLSLEKAIMGSKIARAQFEKVEARVSAMRADE